MKLAVLAVLFFAAATQGQAPTETLGKGTESLNCGQPTWPCEAPVFGPDGVQDGSITIYAGATNLLRYDSTGALVWTSNDYDGTHFSAANGAIHGTLSYTLGQVRHKVGKYGYRTFTFVSGGSLTE